MAFRRWHDLLADESDWDYPASGERDQGQPGQWHFRNGLPADERPVSLGRSGPGVRNGFLETPPGSK